MRPRPTRHARIALGVATAAIAAGSLGCGGDEKSDTTPKPKQDSAKRKASGTGFEVSVPAGFKESAGGSPQGPQDLLLISRVRSGFPVNISVTRTPSRPGETVEGARSIFRQQSEAQGGRDIRFLPDRKIDGEPAIGLSYRRRGPSSVLSQTLYSATRDGSLYTVAFSASVEAAGNAEKRLDGLLDSWRWR